MKEISHKKQNLRVLAISHDFRPTLGGEAEFAYQLAVALIGHSVPLRVLAPPVGTAVAADRNLDGCLSRTLDLRKFQSVRSVRGALGWPTAMYGLTRAINRAARNHRATICLVTSHMTWIMLALEALRLKYAMILHGEEAIWMLSRGPVSRMLFRLNLKRARWIFFNSEHSRQKVVEIVPLVAEKSEALGCGVAEVEVNVDSKGRDGARRALGIGHNPVLLTVAKLVDRKGVDTVIRALPAVLDRHPDCQYIVVGDGPERDALGKLARDVGVAENVVFLGRVDNEKKRLVYIASDIFVMVSQSDKFGAEEGFGIVFLEANLHGLPAIGSRCGGIGEAIEDGVSGMLVEQRSPDQVSNAILDLLANPEKRASFAEAGKARIRERFNWTAISRRVVDRLIAVS